MTAVEYIEAYLKHKGIIIDDKNTPQVLVGVINDAKEMEKQQIIDAHINGQSEYDKGAYRKEVEENSEYYYNETFNGQNT